MTNSSHRTNLAEQILKYGYLSIMAVLPIHALMSVWLTSNFGLERLWQSWKEILLAFLAVAAVGTLINKPRLWQRLISRKVNQLALAYLFLHLILTFSGDAEFAAEVAGLLFNLRFLAMFALAQIVVELWPRADLRNLTLKVVSIGGFIVIGFGLLQATILPNDFLVNFGYGPDTIEPYRTIDQNEDFIRINSTTRGPNPLGLYLVLITTLVASWWYKRPGWLSNQPSWVLPLASSAAVITLYASHSRSGWLGAGLSIGLFFLLALPEKWMKKGMAIVAGGALLGAVILALSWNTDFVQNTVLHQDPGQGPAINSTEAHLRANERALNDILDNPLGEGPGSAGPASFYNDQTSVAENYYLQIGQEVGVVGIIMFGAIIFLVGQSLWLQRTQYVSLVLFTSLIGLSVASLFLHVWAQDETAMIWWGLAGLYIKSPNRT